MQGRFNYAADSNGAKAVASNKEARNRKFVVSHDLDLYMINPCSAPDKWVVLELSEEAFVDTVVRIRSHRLALPRVTPQNASHSLEE